MIALPEAGVQVETKPTLAHAMATMPGRLAQWTFKDDGDYCAVGWMAHIAGIDEGKFNRSWDAVYEFVGRAYGLDFEQIQRIAQTNNYAEADERQAAVRQLLGQYAEWQS